jgi:Family of unknown function (DUF6127)
MTPTTDMTAATLARLSQQIDAQGADPLLLRAIIEEASDLGAMRALERVGLADAAANKDMQDVRALLDAWRATKSSVLKIILGWLFKLLLASLLLGVALEMKLINWR